MRTLSRKQTVALGNGLLSTHMRIRLWEGHTVFENVQLELDNVVCRDHVLSAAWGGTNDTPVEALRVAVRLDYFETTLAPLRTDLRIGDDRPRVCQPITLEVAVMTMDECPRDSDYKLMFQGYIDDLNWGGEDHTLIIAARDRGAIFQDAFIGAEATYGTGPGRAMELVMEDIIFANSSFHSAFSSIWLPTGSPGALVNTYTQTQQPVMEALQTLANIIGWGLKYRFDEAAGEFRLAFYDTAAISTEIEFGFSTDLIQKFPQVFQSRVNVRNIIDIRYLNGGIPNILTVSDAASIADCGPRRMAITEGDTSAIDTVGEATTLGNSALAALKDPELQITIEVPFFWPVQEHDLFAVEGGNHYFDDDQTLTVQGYSHTLQPNGEKTAIRLKRETTVGRRQYLSRDARFFEYR